MNRVWQLVLVAVAVFGLDQISKYWFLFVYALPSKAPVVLHEYFSLVMAWNRGVSFSMFSTSHDFMPYVLASMAVIVSAILVRMGLKSTQLLERIGYGMVIGGALGNAFDRLRFGAVADFFYAHVGELGWPAFNVADMGICVGVGLLLLSIVKAPARS